MADLVHMIDSGSLLGLLLLAGTLCFVGNVMVNADKTARRFGYVMAGVAFFAYAVYGWVQYGEYDPSLLQGLVIRALTAAALALGFFWIIGVGALFCWRHLAKGPSQAIQQFMQSWTRRRRDRKASAAAAIVDPISPEQQKKMEREEKKRDKLRAQRSNFRYELRLLYNQLRKDQLPVFPEKVFEEMMDTALSPENAQTMNQRIEMLREALLTVDNQKESAKAPATEEEVAAHFRERRLFVQNSETLHEGEKVRLLRALNRREGQAYARLIKENYE